MSSSSLLLLFTIDNGARMGGGAYCGAGVTEESTPPPEMPAPEKSAFPVES